MGVHDSHYSIILLQLEEEYRISTGHGNGAVLPNRRKA